MGTGSIDITGYGTPPFGSMSPIGVYLYDGQGNFSLLPNVWCTRIDAQLEGPAPPTARFKYAQDSTYASTLGWPARFEQLWPIDAQGPYVVSPGDRLVVTTLNPDGSPQFLFDGFAQIPQVDVTPNSERVTFAAVGVAIRCYDDVINGRVQRNQDTTSLIDTSGDSDFPTHLPCRFNPADDQARGVLAGFLPNSTVAGLQTENSEIGNYPVFLDPLLAEREAILDTTYLEYWTIADACKYLLAQPDPGDNYVTWPTLNTIDALLATPIPDPSTGTITPDSETVNCVVRDYNASGRPTIEALAELLGYAGFLLSWQLGTGDDGLPETYLNFYRRDAASTTTPKNFNFQPAGSGLVDPSQNDANHYSLVRDCNRTVNAWRVETEQEEVEVTVLLAPLFYPEPGDEQANSDPTMGLGKFQKSNLTTATAITRRKYRWYGADECGDGHWNATTKEPSFVPMDFSPVFPNTKTGARGYAVRYRPGTHTLIATDTDGQPLEAVLEIYTGDDAYSADPYLAPPDDTAVWTTVPKGWRLLDDRLGIEVTVENPNDWVTGSKKAPFAIRGVSWQTLAGTAGYNPFVLRLTTVIKSDRRFKAKAAKRAASPTPFVITRDADGRDNFRKQTVSVNSLNYAALVTAGLADGTDPYVTRDDTQLAVTHAEQLRTATEMPPLAGSATLPYLSFCYEVGDRISGIAGRNVNFAVNAATQSGEAPSYPWVVAVSYSFEADRQQTELHLSDMRHASANWR